MSHIDYLLIRCQPALDGFLIDIEAGAGSEIDERPDDLTDVEVLKKLIRLQDRPELYGN